MLITLIVVLVVIGVLLWAISAAPFIDPGVKQLIRILVVVFAALYVLRVLFPGALGNL